jgi:hypothetical protein
MKKTLPIRAGVRAVLAAAGSTAFAATQPADLAELYSATLFPENLFDRRHAEWGAAANRSEFGRKLMVQLVWRN